MTPPARPLAWLIILGVAAVLGALLWASSHALRLERSEAASRADAAFQESIRLALWRMDSALAPLLTREAARPYFHYTSFYPADRAYTSMWKAVEPGDVLVPSPLLQSNEPFVRLHFQIDDRKQITSPQAPTGTLRNELESANVPTMTVIDAEMALVELDRLFSSSDQPVSAHAARDRADPHDQSVQQPKEAPDGPQAKQEALKDSPLTQREYEKRQQALQNVLPPEQREGQVQAAVADRKSAADAHRSDADLGEVPRPATALASKVAESPLFDKAPGAETAARARGTLSTSPEVEVGDLKPVWKHDARDGHSELFLVRTVNLSTGKYTQGCWLDWPALKESLLSSVRDLFPAADLAPTAEPVDSAITGRMLAAPPPALTPGPPPSPAPVGWTPMRTTLAITWGAVLVTINALAFALLAARELADRRGRFVSAVTHELRTPLTTFTLYSQMLADGIVREDAAKSEYLHTLKREAQRLARIVENVLDYARLGKPGGGARPTLLTLPELLGTALPALRQRAEQAGVTLRLEPDVPRLPKDVRLHADPVTFERILFNLVDNACKYAGTSIDLVTTIRPDRVEISVVDHGPGIPAPERRLVFKPFERGNSLEHASTPGLGLGLSLSRELARRMGGNLSLAESKGPGARFDLSLPRAVG